MRGITVLCINLRTSDETNTPCIKLHVYSLAHITQGCREGIRKVIQIQTTKLKNSIKTLYHTIEDYKKKLHKIFYYFSAFNYFTPNMNYFTNIQYYLHK